MFPLWLFPVPNLPPKEQVWQGAAPKSGSGVFIPQWEKPEGTIFINMMLMRSPDAIGMEPGNPGLEKSILLGQNCKLSFILGGKNGVLLPALVQRVLATVSACMALAGTAPGIGNLVWESWPNPSWTVGYQNYMLAIEGQRGHMGGTSPSSMGMSHLRGC